MSEKVIKNWINIAEYDLQTAKFMLESKRYLYVAFTCQQAIEKIMKAIYIKEKNETPPYTHNLIKLLNYLSLASSIKEEHIRFLEILNSYYIESRYTEEINELLIILSSEKANDILLKTEKLFQWLREKI